MVYRELVDYIKKTQGQGYDEGLISRALVAKGWAKHDILAAFELVNQEKFQPLRGEQAKTKTEIVEEKKVEAQEQKIVEKGFSSSAAWIRCISSPATALTNARYFASFGKSATSFAGAYLLEAAILLLAFYSGASALLSKLPDNISSPLLALSVPFALGITFAGVVAWLLQATFLNLVVWVPAKFLFKGKGSFTQQLYVSSIAFGASFLLFGAAFLVTIASALFETPAVPPFYLSGYAIPVITLAAAVLSLIALLYSLFIHVKAIKIVHELTYAKALLAILVGVLGSIVLTSIALGVSISSVVYKAVGGIGLANHGLANATSHASGAANATGKT